jgi:hypothetical protein
MQKVHLVTITTLHESKRYLFARYKDEDTVLCAFSNPEKLEKITKDLKYSGVRVISSMTLDDVESMSMKLFNLDVIVVDDVKDDGTWVLAYRRLRST